MPNIAVVDMQGKPVGEMTLSDELFAAEVNESAMHLVVRSILAAQRQGTQSALTRGMVRGGGRKIYRQKGTGNARHHGNRAPQFKHGGVVFAPQPRDYVVKVPRKVRRLGRDGQREPAPAMQPAPAGGLRVHPGGSAEGRRKVKAGR